MINTSLFGLSQKNRAKFSSVKEQAFNFMWDGINWKKGIYNNYHYLELCVIIHAWLLLVEVFFKGVHLECEENPYSYNSFYRLFVSKIFTP
jgi:hypothetical protein